MEFKTPEIPQEASIQEARAALAERAAALGVKPEDVDHALKKTPATGLLALRAKAEAMPDAMATVRESRGRMDVLVTEAIKTTTRESIGEFRLSTLSLAQASVSPDTIREWADNLHNLQKLAFVSLHKSYPTLAGDWLKRMGVLAVNSAVDYWLTHASSEVLEEVGHASSYKAFGFDADLGAGKKEGLSVGGLFLDSLVFQGRAHAGSQNSAEETFNLSEFYKAYEKEAQITAAGPNQHGIHAKELMENAQNKGYFHAADIVNYFIEATYSPNYFYKGTRGLDGDPIRHVQMLMKLGKLPQLASAISKSVSETYRQEFDNFQPSHPENLHTISEIEYMMIQKEFKKMADSDLRHIAAFQLAQAVTGAIDPVKAGVDYVVHGKEKSKLLGVTLPGGVFVALPKIYTWMNNDSYSAETQLGIKRGDTNVTASVDKSFVGFRPTEFTLGARHRFDSFSAGGEATVSTTGEHFLKAKGEAYLGRDWSVFGQAEYAKGTMRGERELQKDGIKGWLGAKYNF